MQWRLRAVEYHRIPRAQIPLPRIDDRSDQYIAQAYSPQKTPKESRDWGWKRVVQARHRLDGQVVKVLGEARAGWQVVGAGGETLSLPQAWLEEVTPIIPSTNLSEPWAGMTELLNLVTMIAGLRVQPPEEVDDESPSRDHPSQQPACEPHSSGDAPPALGANPAAAAAGTDPDPGGYADPQTSGAGEGCDA